MYYQTTIYIQDYAAGGRSLRPAGARTRRARAPGGALGPGWPSRAANWSLGVPIRSTSNQKLGTYM